MFFVNNVYGAREPYRVQEIQKDKKDDQGGKGFQGEGEHAHEKILKASEELYKKKSVVLASEIMSKQLIHLKGELSVSEAWDKIKGHTIKHFPILSEEGKLLGILSEKDILRGLQESKGKKLKEMTASKTLCADPDTELGEIMKVFSDHTVEAIPVVDKAHQVVGMLTQNDLLQTMLKITHLKWNT
ncbi:MAG: CBS domain-containing protein [Chlamydiia bacterium]|nr:CBS domain-containing protein [Chlamydiia bacterium]